MRIELKTGWWEREGRVFKEKVSGLIFLFSIESSIGIGYGIYKENLMVTMMFIMFLVIKVIIIISYNKWAKQDTIETNQKRNIE